MIVINIQCSLLLAPNYNQILVKTQPRHIAVRNSELERARHNIVMFLMCTGASDPAVPSALRVGAVHCAPSSLSAHLNNLPRAPAPHSPPTIIACKTICRVKNVPKFADPPSRKYVCISLFCLLSNFIPMKSGVSSQLASGRC